MAEEQPSPEAVEARIGPPRHGGRGDINQAGRDVVQHIYADPGRTLPVPRQLPSGTGAFIDRHVYLSRLDTLLGAADSGSVGIRAVALVGTAGVGKTALALHWAHRSRDRYADGDLYVNLRGYDLEGPVDPAEVLDGFLRAFDIPPDRMPMNQAAREGIYRALLSSRQVLIVLDNAATADQVRPLLPGSSSCPVVITSRQRLGGLSIRNGVTSMELELLPPDEAMALLTTLIGRPAVEDPGSIAEIARLCAYLPLALRIVAERARSRRYVSISDIAEELRAGTDRLDLLAVDDDETTSMAVVFSWSYRALPPAVRHMFQVLGLHPGIEVGIDAAAALAGCPASSALRQLDTLRNVHLVESPEPNRYQLHDLLKAYAVEQARADLPAGEATAAVHQELDWYLHSANNADLLLNPGRRRVVTEPPDTSCRPQVFQNREEALRWFEKEKDNAVAMVRRAAESGMDDGAWRLALALNSFFYQRWYLAEWTETALLGVAAARRLESTVAQAWSTTGLGGAFEMASDWATAIEYYEEALQLWRRSEDGAGEMTGLHNLGNAYREVGRLDDALRLETLSLRLAEELGNRRQEGMSLKGIGLTHSAMNNFAEAARYLERALVPQRQAHDRHTEGMTLRFLADTYHHLGRTSAALETYRQALLVQREIGDRRSEADTLMALGSVYRADGSWADAVAAWRLAHDLFLQMDEPLLAARAGDALHEAESREL